MTDILAGGTFHAHFTTFRPSTGAPHTLAGTPAVSVYKDGSNTQSTAGVTLTADFDSVTGLNLVAVDTSADGTFYSAGSSFSLVVTTGTVDSVSAVGMVVGSFSIARSAAYAKAVEVEADIAALNDLSAGDAAAAVWSEPYTDYLSDSSVFGYILANLPDATTVAFEVWQADPAGWSSTEDTFGYLIQQPQPLDDDAIRAALGLAAADLDTQLAAIPTAAENADAVRTELATELDRIDADITSRLAAGDYTAPDNDGIGTIITALGDIPDADENADALLDRANGVETGYTMRQAARLILSSTVAKLSGAETTTITIRDIGDTKNRIVATVDASGNRSVIETDVS